MEFKYNGIELNGIIRHLVNNSQENSVKFIVSSNHSEKTHPIQMIFRYDDYPERHFATRDVHDNPFFEIIFPFSLGLKHYSIRSTHHIGPGGGYIKKWKLDRSVNGRKWILLDNIESKTDELANYNTSTMTDTNADGGKNLRIANLEFYGIIDPQTSRITCIQRARNRFNVCLFIVILIIS